MSFAAEDLRALGASPRNSWRVSERLADMTRPERTPLPVHVRATPKDVRFDLSRTALLVIDMQNDFCHPDGWLGSIGVDTRPLRKAVAPIATLAPALRAAGVPLIWINWGNRADRANLSPSLLHVYDSDGKSQGIGASLPPHGGKVLQAGEWGCELADGLEAQDTDIRVDKYRMSGFWDTPLDSILRNLRVDTLLFAGVNVDQCVMATLQDGACLGYDCLLLEDCCATSSPAFCVDATMYNVRQCFGFVINSPVLIDAMGAGSA